MTSTICSAAPTSPSCSWICSSMCAGFTPASKDLLELISADIGRPLAHLAQKFNDGDLIANARQVIAKLVPLESEVNSHSGRWYLRRILPLPHRRPSYSRGGDHVHRYLGPSWTIDAAQERLQAVVEQMPAAVLMVQAPSGQLLLGNRQASRLFGQPFPLPFVGSNWTAAYGPSEPRIATAEYTVRQEWPLARALAQAETVLNRRD